MQPIKLLFSVNLLLVFKDVTHQGITAISSDDVKAAQELSYMIKLLVILEKRKSGIFAEDSPTLIPKDYPFSRVNNTMNAFFVESIGLGQSMFYGPGAGQNQQPAL